MNQRNEQISALLDDQFEEQELTAFMQDLKRDHLADGDTLQRYQIMGEVMRDELDQSAFLDVSAAVHRAIEQEPALSEAPSVASKEASGFSFSAWLRPLTGMAIAASVAMITVVSFQTIKNESAQDIAQPVAQVAAPAAVITPVNQQFAQHVHVASTAPLKPSAEQSEQLNEYMINHAGQSSMQGVMPYVRVINLPAQVNP